MSDIGVLELVLQQRLVAIIRLDDLAAASQLCQALFDGGVGVQEFTLTNPNAPAAIANVRRQIQPFQDGRAVVGAGSVRCKQDAARAISAGAQFIVTPTLKLEVIEYCKSQNVPAMCGAFSPTEILTAWEAGAAIVKVFPVRGLGPAYIRDCLAPLPDLKLMPTGGVDLENMGAYFAAGAYAVGVGGNLVSPQSIAAGDWQALTATAQQYMQAVERRSPS